MKVLIALPAYNDIKAGEVPLVLRYDYKKGKSKMKIAKTVKGYFYLLGKVR